MELLRRREYNKIIMKLTNEQYRMLRRCLDAASVALGKKPMPRVAAIEIEVARKLLTEVKLNGTERRST